MNGHQYEVLFIFIGQLRIVLEKTGIVKYCNAAAGFCYIQYQLVQGDNYFAFHGNTDSASLAKKRFFH
ncbi:hypothetical protein A0U92_06390 [Acetobacter aceti]|uniref:Uncharacterized protein n=1 Tax=Acetobacter aceti TaxID=435 RepID=A0A1U9KF84_ACEAC|nr:hypothetical protein A0U92_06390 [Acetobacter aceti]